MNYCVAEPIGYIRCAEFATNRWSRKRVCLWVNAPCRIPYSLSSHISHISFPSFYIGASYLPLRTQHMSLHVSFQCRNVGHNHAAFSSIEPPHPHTYRIRSRSVIYPLSVSELLSIVSTHTTPNISTNPLDSTITLFPPSQSSLQTAAPPAPSIHTKT